MNGLSKIFAASLLASAVGLPYFASTRGWGVGTERSAKVMNAIQKSCVQKDAFGNCARSHRSYFYGRSLRGGGPRFGK